LSLVPYRNLEGIARCRVVSLRHLVAIAGRGHPLGRDCLQLQLVFLQVVEVPVHMVDAGEGAKTVEGSLEVLDAAEEDGADGEPDAVDSKHLGQTGVYAGEQERGAKLQGTYVDHDQVARRVLQNEALIARSRSRLLHNIAHLSDITVKSPQLEDALLLLVNLGEVELVFVKRLLEVQHGLRGAPLGGTFRIVLEEEAVLSL
jgi:hypothetical protein